jgi:hypothetical protein
MIPQSLQKVLGFFFLVGSVGFASLYPLLDVFKG